MAAPQLGRTVHCVPPLGKEQSPQDFVALLPRGTDREHQAPVDSVQCYASTGSRFAYVKTAKAASTKIIGLLTQVAPDLRLTSGCERLEGYTFVTSAREPLERVRSAYGEVDARAAVRSLPPNSSYFTMPRSDEPSRFLAFLNAVYQQRFSHLDYVSGSMPQHAEPPLLLRTPVALRTPVTLRVLRSERLLEDWTALLNVLRPGRRAPGRLSRYHVGEAQRARLGLAAVAEQGRAFNMTRQATCHACALLRREYTCFGYPFPPECAGFEAQPLWPPGYSVTSVGSGTAAQVP